MSHLYVGMFKYQEVSTVLRIYSCTHLEDVHCFLYKKWPQLHSNIQLTYSVPGHPYCQVESEDDFQNISILVEINCLKVVDFLVGLGVCESSGSRSISCGTDAVGNLTSSEINTETISDTLNTWSSDSYTQNLEDDFDNGVPALANAKWLHCISGLNQEFMGGADQFRKSLIKFTHASGFEFKYLRNDPKRVTAVCAQNDKGCLWRIHATADVCSGYFYVREYASVHNCQVGILKKSNKRLNSSIVGDELSDTLRKKPKYRPVDVVYDFARDYGIDISYYIGYCALEKAKSLQFGSYKLCFDQLRLYAEFARKSNPDSHIFIESDPITSRFTRFFMSLYAYYEGFNYCRPMLFLDSTFLTGRFRGQMMCATAKDGNNHLFPIAYAIVDIENEENWTWFMNQLSVVLNPARVITFISDRHKGLLESVSKVFPDSPHSYCTIHLKYNLRTHAAGRSKEVKDALVKKFNNLTYANTVERFQYKLEELKKCAGYESKVSKFLDSIQPEHYSFAYFKGNRYGEVTSNAAESLNNMFKKERQLPIVGLVDSIRLKMMDQMAAKRVISEKWNSIICPHIVQDIADSVKYGLSWEVVKASDDIYEVRAKKTVIVDLDKKSCSCHSWENKQFPCSHAFAAIGSSGRDLNSFIDYYYHTETFRKTYALPVYPVPTLYMPMSTEERLQILPPIGKSQPGRRPIQRKRNNGEPVRNHKCTKCKKSGHNSSTCRNMISHSL